MLDHDGYLMDVPRRCTKGSIYWYDCLVYKSARWIGADFRFGNRWLIEITKMAILFHGTHYSSRRLEGG